MQNSHNSWTAKSKYEYKTQFEEETNKKLKLQAAFSGVQAFRVFKHIRQFSELSEFLFRIYRLLSVFCHTHFLNDPVMATQWVKLKFFI